MLCLVKVKVCGIRTVEHARAAVEAGSDAIGFIFADSRRKVSIASAREISDSIPSSVKKIGVFVNECRTEIEKIAAQVQLDYVQLHGDETADFMNSLTVPSYKALSIQGKEDLNGCGEFPGRFILFDSGHGEARGGNGTTFDWSYLKEVSLNKQLILAGGLHAENVRHAIMDVNPYMVDVSSGVEVNGMKDVQKIKEFIRIVKTIRK
ncbi:phosphoribosylanthranilate isomerase [Bacillus salacetis]|uniref:N-(5'-phosphoribosyl)anthranilate isomerase n=1 Tax=Bacillus salacetis TaxID=2315464 RepID=A0A3A1R0C7_9BACI|nr:phosphoribosylanthranilate isomerase [Bacillus salacetis]RIW35059.1 phosphoribosylanthranilate isomerase [Bacillus salacetis]